MSVVICLTCMENMWGMFLYFVVNLIDCSNKLTRPVFDHWAGLSAQPKIKKKVEKKNNLKIFLRLVRLFVGRVLSNLGVVISK